MDPGRRKVIWSDQARSALDEAVAYISQDSPSAAIRLLEEALDAGASLAELAERGRIVPEVGSAKIENCSF
jgi:plasmid stabilization system protein ParE